MGKFATLPVFTRTRVAFVDFAKLRFLIGFLASRTWTLRYGCYLILNRQVPSNFPGNGIVFFPLLLDPLVPERLFLSGELRVAELALFGTGAT